MTELELLELIGNARDKYVLETAKTRVPRKGHLRLSRTALIAAIIVMALLLAGCTVAVFLRLQDMEIGQERYTWKYDDQGYTIPPTEKIQEVITFYGHGGSPAQLAAREWYEFTKTYEPGDVGNVSNLPNVPDLYEYNYGCLDEEMVAKIDEIAAKYNLKLLDTRIDFQREQTGMVLEALGIPSLFRADARADCKEQEGMVYPPSNFRCNVTLTLTGEDALWKKPVSGKVFYSRKDYFPMTFYQSYDESFQQWDYTAADGTKLLLALSDQGYGYIIADLPDAMLGIDLDISLNNKLFDGLEAPTREVLQQLADTFDYHIKPGVTDAETLRTRLKEDSEERLSQRKPMKAGVSAGFDDHIIKQAIRLRNYDYCFYDINGDGKEDMLFADRTYGGLTVVLTPMEDGTITSHDGRGLRLLKNGSIGDYPNHVLEDKGFIHLFAPYSETQPLVFLDDGINYQGGETVFRGYWSPEEGWMKATTWDARVTSDYAPISDEEIEALLAEYAPLELPWAPATAYPLDSGKTLGELLQEMDVRLSEEDLRAEYVKFAAEQADDYDRYCLRDINGDGVTDLLLSSDRVAEYDPVSATYYSFAVTYRYGTIIYIPLGGFYLCEDGVLEQFSWNFTVDTGLEETHRFSRLRGDREETLADITYRRSKDSWVTGNFGESFSTAEAEAILAQYPRIDQGMRPLSELIG